MNSDFSLLVKDIPEDELELFLKKTNSTLTAKKSINKLAVDYGWVDVLDESIPYLDNIIRNPRRFIAQEEDIIPIEKTKKVSEESIKHLATHTQLIQEVDEDGTVKPLKLLNIFKEETIDLYENRFIYSLITNLYVFLRNQLTYEEEEQENKEEKRITYEANTKMGEENIKISMSISANKEETSKEDPKKIEERKAKIQNIKEVLEGFMASKFMKSMANATPVRSPIRKTNVILKEQNFIKALALWEFLEKYQIEKPVKKIEEEKDLNYKNLDHNLGLSYYLNYSLLENKIGDKGKDKINYGTDIISSIRDYARKFTVNEIDLKKEIEKEIKLATKYKEEQITSIKGIYKSFLDLNKSHFDKAISILR
mgnify:CR=1 FL=1